MFKMDQIWNQSVFGDIDWLWALDFDLPATTPQPNHNSLVQDFLGPSVDPPLNINTDNVAPTRNFTPMSNTIQHQTLNNPIALNQPTSSITANQRLFDFPSHIKPSPLAKNFDQDGLSSEFEQALDAVRNDSKRQLTHRGYGEPRFDRFRVSLSTKTTGFRGPRTKRQRLKRSVTRPCLLCKYLKLKCSPGRPCARCVEKYLGQEDLDFTHCLRDHPSSFNPFILDTGQAPRGSSQGYHDLGMLCHVASNMAALCKSPQLFVWLFSYTCYLRAHEPPERENLLAKPGAALFWRVNQSQLSQSAFQHLEKTINSRDSGQHATDNNGRSLVIALSLYAWLGATCIEGQISLLSEKEETCRRYLSEYIDLLLPRYMPTVPSAIIRNLLWTMHDLMAFPAIPQLKLDVDTLRHMRSEVELAVTFYRRLLLQTMSLPAATPVNVWGLGERFRNTYWPNWHSCDMEDDLGHWALQQFHMYTVVKQNAFLWNLKPRESERLDSSLRNRFENCLEVLPYLAKVRSWLEWMDNAQRMLEGT